MTTKIFNHNGGVWTRPDIPTATPQPWKCHICKKDIDSQPEEYKVVQGANLIDKIRFFPASRYWHGDIVGIEFCSVECSFQHFEQEHYSNAAK